MQSAPNTTELSALSWSSSILGLVVLQRFSSDNYTLLFWWITTLMIAIATLSVCFTPPSLPLRAVFRRSVAGV